MTRIRCISLTLFILLVLSAALICVSAEETLYSSEDCAEGTFMGHFACTANGMLHVCPHNFADQAFYEFMCSKLSKGSRGYLSVSDLEKITELRIDKSSQIVSLGGIEFLYNLQVFVSTSQNIGILDFSNNNRLTYLECPENLLTQLILGNQPNLTYLDCHRNSLRELDISQCPALVYLDCRSLSLSSLDFSQCPALEYLDSSNTLYAKLDLRNCHSISELKHSSKQLLLPLNTDCPITMPFYGEIYDALSTNFEQFDISQVIGRENISNVIRITAIPTSTGGAISSEIIPYDPLTGIATVLRKRVEYYVCEYTLLDPDTKEAYRVFQNFKVTCVHELVPGDCRKNSSCAYCSYIVPNTRGPHSWLPAEPTELATCAICGTRSDHPLEHVWLDATCTTGTKCRYCSKTKGDPIPHTWKQPTETQPKTCLTCGLREGHPLEHVWKEATYSKPETCRYCDETRGSPLPHEHQWRKATCEEPKACFLCGVTEGTTLPHTPQVNADCCKGYYTCKFCRKYITVLPEHAWIGRTLFSPEMCRLCGKEGLPPYLSLLSFVAIIGAVYAILMLLWIRNYLKIKCYPDIPSKKR